MNEVIIKEEKNIENMIYEVRGKQVMLDSDLARLFGYETKQINRQVLRNINRFPEKYCFRLTYDEYNSLRCQKVTLKSSRGEHRKYLPYVFTEYGVTMLAGILKSDIAVQISLRIVEAFIKMKKYISSELMEQKYVNNLVLKHDSEIKQLQQTFDKLNDNKVNEIYFEGQIYDAYSKIIDIMSLAKDELIIIDNYADKSMLDMISKANSNVILITKRNNLLKQIDIDKYNKQYHNLKTIYNNTFHDRYIIIDNEKIYHCGTSLNHIGSKTFSINLLEDNIVKESLLNKIKKII